jgi:hypothetical protein
MLQAEGVDTYAEQAISGSEPYHCPFASASGRHGSGYELLLDYF